MEAEVAAWPFERLVIAAVVETEFVADDEETIVGEAALEELLAEENDEPSAF